MKSYPLFFRRNHKRKLNLKVEVLTDSWFAKERLVLRAKHVCKFSVITMARKDLALYKLPPFRKKGTIGRPRKKGKRIKPEFKDKMVFRDARSSSAKATYSSLLYQYEKTDKLSEGWEFMKALDHNTKKYYGSGSLQFQAVGRKEAPLSFAVLSSVIINKEKGLPLEIIDAESGSPIITDAIAVIKNAQHPNAAAKFLTARASEVETDLKP